MKRLLNLYIIREITSLFLLGMAIFTLVLLMGRLIKLTDLVISRGVPLADVLRMIGYLMPSLLIFTIPMAFLLAVLLAFGRLSADNEVTVMKASGISLVQLMPPVILCGVVAALLTLAAATVGVPWGNMAFKRLSFQVLKQNVSATIREKVFWDEIPGIVLYTDHYDEERRMLEGVIIHDGRDRSRPLTVFAAEGRLENVLENGGVRLVLQNGSIHALGRATEYRLVNFGHYSMTISAPGNSTIGTNEQDLGIGELLHQIDDPATPSSARLKLQSELQGRFALPCASLVFAVLAVPLGLQNHRSGKSAGFSLSIGILLAYYVLLSLLRTLAERGTLPAGLALWTPNLLFLILGWFLLKMVSQEKSIPLPDFRLFRPNRRVDSQ